MQDPATVDALPQHDVEAVAERAEQAAGRALVEELREVGVDHHPLESVPEAGRDERRDDRAGGRAGHSMEVIGLAENTDGAGEAGPFHSPAFKYQISRGHRRLLVAALGTRPSSRSLNMRRRVRRR